MSQNKRVLYISYDGMTDPLGQSQVIPYLAGLSAKGWQITLLSSEKPEKFHKQKDAVSSLLQSFKIQWIPVQYTKNPPVLSTLWDILKILKKADSLHKSLPFGIVHCRSYIAAFGGMWLKKKYKVKFLFDMRGFYADERVDGQIWNLKNPVYRFIYHYFKHKEEQFLSAADEVISLTQAGKMEIHSWYKSPEAGPEIEVIPCCADLDHFSFQRIHPEDQNHFRTELNLNENELVISYLGSLGTWYMIDEMLQFFKLLLPENPSSKFLVITHDNPKILLTKAAEKGIPERSIRIRPATRNEVPVLLSLSHFSLFFILPVYSKKASSPTKMAEILGMGVPVICNAGVGDVDQIMEETCPELLLKNFTALEMEKVIRIINSKPNINKETLRKISLRHFSLVDGIKKIDQIYTRILQV